MSELWNEIERKLEKVTRRSNGEYMACCPFHHDETPSLAINVDKGVFHCFGCGEKGTLYKLAKELRIEISAGFKLDNHKAYQKLMDERLIRKETIEKFMIKADYESQAWRYPVSGGYRYKNYYKKDEFQKLSPERKYLKYWHDKGVKNQVYGLVEALEHMSGDNIIYYLNGEPSVWTCWQAGIPAISSIYGEGKIPSLIINEFQEVGLEPNEVKIVIIFDNDETGEKASIEAYERLKNLGFNVAVKRLPSFLPQKADVQDLYIYLKGDDEKFRITLQTLPEVDMNTKKKKNESTVYEIIENLQIDKLVHLIVDGEDIYYLYFKSGEYIQMEDKDIVNKSRFATKIMNRLGIFVKFGKEFEELVNTLLANQVKETIGSQSDEIDDICDEIQKVLNNMSEADDAKEIVMYPTKFVDREQGKIYIKRSFLEIAIGKNYARRKFTEAIHRLGGRVSYIHDDKHKTIRALEFPIDLLIELREENPTNNDTNDNDDINRIVSSYGMGENVEVIKEEGALVIINKDLEAAERHNRKMFHDALIEAADVFEEIGLNGVIKKEDYSNGSEDDIVEF